LSKYFTPAETIMISVRKLQCSDGYGCPILFLPPYIPAIKCKLLGKFHRDSFKTERLACEKADGQWSSASDPDQEYIYFIGLETLPSTCYILSDDSGIPFYSTSNWFKNNTIMYIFLSVTFKVNGRVYYLRSEFIFFFHICLSRLKSKLLIFGPEISFALRVNLFYSLHNLN